MGGCRCAYKNCTLRTDGVTHMFHFPVFDKFRCHQWLTNAEKLEFLNLKVSQLKNRVICQHHFRDDNFMNFRKDKLTFDAVPTENGPYCDSSQLSDKTMAQDDSKLYTISLEDIENEYLTFNDKKANFSVKYGDFLTNCDMMDLDSFNLTNDNTQNIKDNNYDYRVDDKNQIILNVNIDQGNAVTVTPVHVNSLDQIEQGDNTYTIQIENPNEVDKMQGSLMMPIINSINTVPNIAPSESHENNTIVFNQTLEPPRKRSSRSMLKNQKITILNEENISEPVILPAKLEPVSPSKVLPLPNKRKIIHGNLTENNNKHNTNFITIDPIDLNSKNALDPTIGIIDPVDLDIRNVLDPTISIEKKSHNTKSLRSARKLRNVSNLRQINSGINTNMETSVVSQPPVAEDTVVQRVSKKKNSNSLLRNKIPPEKKAAIEEKRKFNIKLRDIITSCLDKLDDQEGQDYPSKLESQIEKNITQKGTTYLAKEPQVPDYTVTYLEARMKKMEDILLNKIDQNTQRIVELKQSLSPVPNKKAAHTQTVVNEEVQKKQLYQDISKYLSPEANSLLYEELFINRFVPNKPQSSSSKKRKYR